MRALAEIEANITVTVIAIRGERLVLTRVCSSNRSLRHGEFGVELLIVAEVDTEERISANVVFDVDDIDAAFAELDARYLAGEAAAHARTWSVIVGGHARFNRQELPATTADPVYIDHRPVVSIEGGDLATSVRAVWDITPAASVYVEAVHRLDELGAVATQVVKGTSREGFDAEWRVIVVGVVEGELLSHYEVFDEADLDAALARFDELRSRTPLLENAATRARERTADAINLRDVDGVLATATSDARYQDRRKGLRDEGTVTPAVVRAVFEAPTGWRLVVAPVAVRGSRLALTRDTYRDTDDVDRPITAEHLMVTEISPDGLVRNSVLFDPDNINGAMAELTARWIASGEVAHPEVIKLVQRLTEAINRHDWNAFATLGAGATYVNYGQLASPGVETIADSMSSIRMMASLVPDFWVELAEVLTQSAIGVVNHVVLRGTSADGVAMEIPHVVLVLSDGDRVTRFETFDSDQRDLALARFEELSGKSGVT